MPVYSSCKAWSNKESVFGTSSLSCCLNTDRADGFGSSYAAGATEDVRRLLRSRPRQVFFHGGETQHPATPKCGLPGASASRLPSDEGNAALGQVPQRASSWLIAVAAGSGFAADLGALQCRLNYHRGKRGLCQQCDWGVATPPNVASDSKQECKVLASASPSNWAMCASSASLNGSSGQRHVGIRHVGCNSKLSVGPKHLRITARSPYSAARKTMQHQTA